MRISTIFYYYWELTKWKIASVGINNFVTLNIIKLNTFSPFLVFVKIFTNNIEIQCL